MSIGEQLKDLPIAGMIVSLAQGIAQAQLELDSISMQVAQLMAGTQTKNRVFFGKRSYSLLDLGLTPTFYQFTETTLEIKMSVSMTIQSEGSPTGKYAHAVNTVDASFANKFQYSVEGSSLVRSRMVPVPPPAILYERILQMSAEERKYRQEMGEG